MTSSVDRSIELAVGGAYEHVRSSDFRQRLNLVADAVGWPRDEEQPQPDSFYDPVREPSSND